MSSWIRTNRNRPYADKWAVAWETAKGEKFEKTLDLTDKFPKRFEGRLVFTSDAENNLRFVTESFSGEIAGWST